MEFIQQYIGEFITLFVGGGAAWLWARVKTRRERKSDDFTFLSDSLTKMQENVRMLTVQNDELMSKIVEMQDKIIAYMNENISLKGDVERLTREVQMLRRELAKFNKKKESNENE
jgi:CII-binding regulator of phage lambda lysogenization HflD